MDYVMISLCAFDGMHAGVCAKTKRTSMEGGWGGPERGTGGRTSLMSVWSDVDGHVGSGEWGLTKRGRCFSQQARSREAGRGRAVYHHLCTHTWLLIALFDPFYPQSSQTCFSTRGRSVCILWQGQLKSFKAAADTPCHVPRPRCSLFWISCWYARQRRGHTQYNRAGGCNEKMKPSLMELAAIWFAFVCSVLYLLLRNALLF